MHHSIPAEIVSGSTNVWTERHREFPSSDWQLSYHLRGAVALDVVATQGDDNEFLISLTAATGMTPVPLPIGQYYFQRYATNLADNSIKRMVGNGRVSVLPDLSDPSLTTYDGRTANEIMLDAIDAMLAKKATRDQESYTIGQRTLKRIPLDQLLAFRKTFAALVDGERRRDRVNKGNSPFETIHFEFGTPGFGRHGARAELFDGDFEDEHDGF